MTNRKEVYRCTVCGNIVEVLHAGAGELTCCGQPMKLLKENSVDAATEKHVPVIEKIDGGYRVTVGSVEHPMLDNHYIEWIELVEGDKTQPPLPQARRQARGRLHDRRRGRLRPRILQTCTGSGAQSEPPRRQARNRLTVRLLAKGRLSHAERRPFSVPFAAFWTAKDGLSGFIRSLGV